MINKLVKKIEERRILAKSESGPAKSLLISDKLCGVCNLQLMAENIPAAADIISSLPTNLWKVKIESTSLVGLRTF